MLNATVSQLIELCASQNIAYHYLDLTSVLHTTRTLEANESKDPEVKERDELRRHLTKVHDWLRVYGAMDCWLIINLNAASAVQLSPK